jgi:uncharacterized protein (DUF58 family)
VSAAVQHRPRIRLRPTAAAAYLVFFLICVYGGAVHYQSNAAYLVLALSSACALVSAVHARRNLEGVSVAATPPPPALCGDALLGALTLKAGAQGVASLAIQLPEAGSAAVASVVHLAAGGSVELPFALPPRPRGEFRLARVRISTTFPLGLFRAWVELELPLCWLVYPRPLPAGLDEPPDDAPAEASTREMSGAGDFLGHRSWTPGEPQRRVDWRAVARGGPLLVKQYGGGVEASRELSWAKAGKGDVEERLARLAGRVLAAEQAGAAYALTLPGQAIAAANGPQHFHHCMGALARFPG